MLPKVQYRVVCKGAKRMKYAERGGGAFTALVHAEARRDTLLKAHPEADVRIYATYCDWKEMGFDDLAS